MSLFTIDSEIKAILDGAFESVDADGEVEIDFAYLLELKEERATKLENIALYIKNLIAEADAIRKEEITLAERRKSMERKIERLQGLMLNSMIENEEKEVSSPKYVAKVRYTDVTEIEDEDLIPEEFMTEKVVKNPDKMAIKKAIKAGQEVSGARVIAKPSINIK